MEGGGDFLSDLTCWKEISRHLHLPLHLHFSLLSISISLHSSLFMSISSSPSFSLYVLLFLHLCLFYYIHLSPHFHFSLHLHSSISLHIHFINAALFRGEGMRGRSRDDKMFMCTAPPLLFGFIAIIKQNVFISNYNLTSVSRLQADH